MTLRHDLHPLQASREPLLDKTFRQWTTGLDPVRARIRIFERVRDIPYAVLPELIDAGRYVDILRVGRGSCTPKHFLLAEMFRRLGLLVLFAVYPFRWGQRAEILDNYPARLKEMAKRQPVAYHLACRVEIGGRLVLVDATLDAALARLEPLPINLRWDGVSDTQLPMTPTGEELVFHPVEAHRMKPVVTPDALEFYAFLNRCMEDVRRSGAVALPQARSRLQTKIR